MVKQLATEGKSAILDAVLKDFKRKPPAEPMVTTFLVQATEMQDELKIAMNAQFPVATGSIYSAAFMDRAVYEPRRAFRTRHGLNGFFPYNLLGELPRLTHPTLILVGRYDFVTPEPYARQMAYGIGPQATVVVLENSAHAGFFEENSRVTELVGHFLGRPARPGEVQPGEAFPLSMLQSEARPVRRRSPSPREAVDACRLGLRYLGY
jgi:pimeloyl-ACP methyl ester carboxylesterase